MQLAQPRDDVLERRGRRQVEDHRPDLRPQEVVGARRAERRQPRVLGPADEVEDDLAVGVVADLRPVGRGQPADERQERGRAGVALRLGERLVAGDRRPERLGPAVLRDEALGRPDDLERARLALRGRVAPGGDPVAAEDRPDRLGVCPPDLGHVETELEARPAPVDPGDAIAEAAPGQRLAVGGGRERDPRIGVEVVDVGGVDEAVHRGVDRRRRAASSVEAVVERGDHLVLALDAGIDVDERAQAVEAQDGEPGLGQRAEVAAGALDPQQLDRRAGHRIDAGPLGRRVAAGVVGVARVRAEPVRALEELADGRARARA